MNTSIRATVVAILVSLSFVTFVVSPSAASHPRALLIAPEPDHYLPKFGFSSFNIAGVGERVTHVKWGGLASRFGLEPGDVILSMNGFRLNYHGSWNDALRRAMSNGGHVRLRIRDVRTGHTAFRQMYLGDGVGPVTPKYHVAGGVGSHRPHVTHRHDDNDYRFGPVTVKSQFRQNDDQDVNKRLKQIANLFEE